MNTFLNKIHQVCNELVNEQGHFDLFACIELVSNKGEWDIVVCADAWLPKRKKLAINLIMDKIEQVLNEDDLLNLARIIVLNKEDYFYKELSVLIENDRIGNHHVSVAGLDIKNINILKSSAIKDEASICEVQELNRRIYNKIHEVKTHEINYTDRDRLNKYLLPLSKKGKFETKQNPNLLYSNYDKHKKVAVCH
ncbi:MAG: hypothetical protein WAX77_06415 [Methylococcaceae bacterium]